MGSLSHDDSPTGDFGDTKPEVSPAVNSRPRFDVERRDLSDLILGENGLGRARNKHTPALAHGVIDSINLETDRGIRSDRCDFRHLGRTEHDITLQHLEVDGESNWPSPRAKDHPAHTSPAEKLLTFGIFDLDQVRARGSFCGSVSTSLLSAKEVRDGYLKCQSDAL